METARLHLIPHHSIPPRRPAPRPAAPHLSRPCHPTPPPQLQSVGGVQTDLSDTLLAVNIGDGAHHSDLSHDEPSDADTADVQQARARVGDILAGWLEQAQGKATN